MIFELRNCPDCGLQREFSQPHVDAGSCPDSADGLCPERYCLTCGAALLTALLPVVRPVTALRVRAAAGRLGRVA